MCCCGLRFRFRIGHCELQGMSHGGETSVGVPLCMGLASVVEFWKGFAGRISGSTPWWRCSICRALFGIPHPGRYAPRVRAGSAPDGSDCLAVGTSQGARLLSSVEFCKGFAGQISGSTPCGRCSIFRAPFGAPYPGRNAPRGRAGSHSEERLPDRWYLLSVDGGASFRLTAVPPFG